MLFVGAMSSKIFYTILNEPDTNTQAPFQYGDSLSRNRDSHSKDGMVMRHTISLYPNYRTYIEKNIYKGSEHRQYTNKGKYDEILTLSYQINKLGGL